MTILDDINAEIAQLQKLVPTPQAPYHYGTDLSCVSDLTPDMRETDPESVQGIAEMLVRMWTTDRDSIPDAPGRGWNVRRLLNRAFTASELAAQEGMAAAEAEADDRVETADVSLEVVRETRTVNITARITPKSLALQPFDFTVAVVDGAALLELLQ